MPWGYTRNPQLPIVEVEFSGDVTAHDLQEATSTLIALEKEEGVNRFLIDPTKMVFAASMTDVYNLPEKQYVEEQADRSGRVAVILPTSPEEREAVQFYETACRNRGWHVKAFADTPEAVEWLTQDISVDELDVSKG